MRLSPAVALAFIVCVIVVGGLSVDSVLAPPPPPCDGDHDNYGCNGTTDCNDNVAAINPGANEVCNAVDDDCDGLVDEGLGYTTCGTGICARSVPNCGAGGTTNTCPSPTFGAQAEVCNGLDDNCDGIVDNLTGTDADGDGASPPCDCNDADPLIHLGAIDVCNDGVDQDCDGNVDDTMSDGVQHWCVSLEPYGPPVIDQPSPIVVKAFHPAGVARVVITDEFGYQSDIDCSGTPPLSTCDRTIYFGRAYRGTATMSSALYKTGGPSGTLVGSVQRDYQFACGTDYCNPDPNFASFASWMRQKSVPECVIGETFRHLVPPLKEDMLRPHLRKRPRPMPATLTVPIIDVIATDAGAINRPLGGPDASCGAAGTPPSCTADPSWPAFCPSQVPADTAFLQAKLRQTYGITLTLQYTRRCTNYAQEIGAPDCHTVQGQVVCFYPPRGAFLASLNLPEHAFVHYAIQSLNGNPLGDMTGAGTAGNLVEESFEPDTINGLGTYSHEWGHTWGLDHTAYGPVFAALNDLTPDGVMDNSYLIYQTAGDPLSPMERYILEPTPPEVWTDAATWGQNYNTALNDLVFPCGPVDPALVGPGSVVLNPNIGGHDFTFKLANLGTGRLGFASLRAYDGDLTGFLIQERMVSLDRGEKSTYSFSIPGATSWGQVNITRGRVLFVLDQPDVIPVAAGDVAANNSLTVNMPACTDADTDGYTQNCTSCYNVLCPVLDCYDGSALVNPAAPEGPHGATSCSDGIDDNCNTTIDLADPLCQPSPNVVKASADVPGQGTVVGTYQATQVAEPTAVYETFTESGSGTRLTHTWTFTNVTAGTSHDLIVKAYRPASAENESFKFSFQTGNNYTDIPNAVISNPAPEATERVFHFPSAISGTVQVRITDVTKNGSTPDTVKVDYLVIRTNP
jgi:hypothetical protein